MDKLKVFLRKLGFGFQRFMQGRNGVDDLAKMLNNITLVLLGLSILTGWLVFYVFALVLIVYTYFRIFSKNVPKRYAENQKYRNWRDDRARRRNKRKQEWQQRKIYCFFRCPMCKQRVRVPKGRGKICITCPKCKQEFVKRT